MANNNNLELLLAVCAAMQETGLVTSKAEFSTRMLGKSPSYLSSMAARNRRVDDHTISELKRTIELWIETPNLIQTNRPADLLPVYLMISAFEHSAHAAPVSEPRKEKGVRRVSGYRWWSAMKARLWTSPSKR